MIYKYLLSLVMPTYNRQDEIQISVKTILNTIPLHHFAEKIELLILDNCSNYDIEIILKEIFRLSKNKLTIRLIKNGENIGNDQNFLKGLCEAQGRYILQCSDRYYYHIDFRALIPFLENENPSCVIFSDRFRKFSSMQINHDSSYKDEWLSQEFNILHAQDSFFKMNRQELLNSNYIKKGLINGFSDLILLNRGSGYFIGKFDEFKKSHMLGVTAQLDAISEANTIHIFRISFNNITHQNIGKGNLYTRHNYNEVLEGNILIQEHYPFIGTPNEIKTLQVSNLMNLFLKDKAGLYLAFIKPDKELINKIVKDNNLSLKWHQKIDLFFINYLSFSIILKSYLFFKNIYLTLKIEFAKFKNDSIIVKQLEKDFEKQL